jgi:hypothetical protein
MRLTERQMIQGLKEAGDRYAPLKVGRVDEQVRIQLGFRGYSVDAIMQFSIQNGTTFKALVEVSPVPTPKNILDKTRLLNDYVNKMGNPDNIVPMIVAPYIGAKQARILADEGISWIDLTGNMSVRVSDQIYIERTGKPNRFPDTSPIKKIFQGKSALVSRALLLKPDGFSKLNEIVDFINSRNANVSISMVSKVLKALEEELLVTKDEKGISVTDSEKLLDRLTEGYRNSTERKRRNSYKYATDKFDEMLFEFNERREIDFLICGIYAAQIKGLAVTDQKTIFVKDIEKVRRAIVQNQIRITPDTEFGNLNIIETNDPGVWFNAAIKPISAVVDDIELYLEMMVDTPRGPEIAEQLRKRILRRADSNE